MLSEHFFNKYCGVYSEAFYKRDHTALAASESSLTSWHVNLTIITPGTRFIAGSLNENYLTMRLNYKHVQFPPLV